MESKAPRLRTARIVITALAATLMVKIFVIDFAVCEGRSMLPSVEPGSVLLVNRAAYGLRNPFGAKYLLRWSKPGIGDVVLFSSPDGNVAVKRCASYATERLFLALGDNAPESMDSRNYGPVDVENVLGKAVGIK